MTRQKRPELVNLIGVALVVVALVSAGGLYYVAAAYADISETFAKTSAFIPMQDGVEVLRDNQTGIVTVYVHFLVDNRDSDLDIEVYRIEYRAFADQSTSSIMNYDKDVGGGSVGRGNHTVPAGEMREITVSFSIVPGTTNMERFSYAEQGEALYMFINGIVWYNIVKYPEASQRLDGVFFMNQVVVQTV